MTLRRPDHDRGRQRRQALDCGRATYPAARSVQSGVIEATAEPAGAYLSFADDGTSDFEHADAGTYQVRMPRIDALLLVEHNAACGGSMVTFTGLYRRAR